MNFSAKQGTILLSLSHKPVIMVHYCPKCRYLKRQTKSWRQIASWLGYFLSLRVEMSHSSGLILGSGLHPEASSNRFQSDTPSHALQMHSVCSTRPPPCFIAAWGPHLFSWENLSAWEVCPWGRVLEGQSCALQKAGAWGLSTSFLHVPGWSQALKPSPGGLPTPGPEPTKA